MPRTGHATYDVGSYSAASCKEEAQDPVSLEDFVDGETVIVSQKSDCYKPASLCDSLGSNEVMRDPMNRMAVTKAEKEKVCKIAAITAGNPGKSYAELKDVLDQAVSAFEATRVELRVYEAAEIVFKEKVERILNSVEEVGAVGDEEVCNDLKERIVSDTGFGFPQNVGVFRDTMRVLLRIPVGSTTSPLLNRFTAWVQPNAWDDEFENVVHAIKVFRGEEAVEADDELQTKAWLGLQRLVLEKMATATWESLTYVLVDLQRIQVLRADRKKGKGLGSRRRTNIVLDLLESIDPEDD